MTDMLGTIVPRSDQLNADSLIGGQTLTIKITKVSGKSGDQPIALNYEDDKGKPYYPCKSMRRVLVNTWGADGSKYVGRSLTLYRDDKVTFGGIAVGGLRISHLSDISGAVTMALTASKANKKPFTVQPLVAATTPSLRDNVTYINDSENMAELESRWNEAKKLFPAADARADLVKAKDARKAELTPKNE